MRGLFDQRSIVKVTDQMVGNGKRMIIPGEEIGEIPKEGDSLVKIKVRRIQYVEDLKRLLLKQC